MSEISYDDSRTQHPDRGRERAESEGLLPIAEHWELHCKDCGYRDRDAYVTSVCPFCGGPRAGPRLPPIEELIYELAQCGIDISTIAQSVGVSGANLYRWQNENYGGVDHSTHERLAKYHSDQLNDE